MSNVQWWLATIDQHDWPTLCDGPHSDRAGADRAMYLFDRLHLTKEDERYGVARVEIFEPQPNAAGVNESAIDTLNASRKANRP